MEHDCAWVSLDVPSDSVPLDVDASSILERDCLTWVELNLDFMEHELYRLGMEKALLYAPLKGLWLSHVF